MPITVHCPACRRTLKLKDDLAGRRIRCPGCQGVVDVPVVADDEPVDVQVEILEEEVHERQRPPAKSSGGARSSAGARSSGRAEPSAPARRVRTPAASPQKSQRQSRHLSDPYEQPPADLPPRRGDRAGSDRAAAGRSRTAAGGRSSGAGLPGRWRRHWVWITVLVVWVQAFFFGKAGLVIAVLVAGVGVVMTLIGGLLPMLLIIVKDPGTVLTMIFFRSARFEMMNQGDDSPYKQLVQGSFTKYRPLFWKGVLLVVSFIPAAFIHSLGTEVARRAAVNDVPEPAFGHPRPPWLQPDAGRR